MSEIANRKSKFPLEHRVEANGEQNVCMFVETNDEWMGAG